MMLQWSGELFSRCIHLHTSHASRLWFGWLHRDPPECRPTCTATNSRRTFPRSGTKRSIPNTGRGTPMTTISGSHHHASGESAKLAISVWRLSLNRCGPTRLTWWTQLNHIANPTGDPTYPMYVRSSCRGLPFLLLLHVKFCLSMLVPAPSIARHFPCLDIHITEHGWCRLREREKKEREARHFIWGCA